ncbi:MAG: YdcF family protein [Bacteroidetes bacterium]|nr:MAG: YdcF family protein [Bacteroidota bacterium]
MILKKYNKLLTFILLIFIGLSSCSKYAYKLSAKHAPYDAIIVPGVPFDGNEWNDVMKMRVYWSYLLYQRGITKNIIYSGAAVYSPYYEAVIMKLYAEKLGIPESRIFTDTLAEHSTENLWYSYKLAKEEGFKKIALATDPFQNFMMRKFKLDNDLNIRVLPIIFKEVDTFMNLKSPVIDPSPAFKKNFISIEKRESKLKQFTGTLGLNIE